MHVTVFERDASAIRGEGKYRGPIQIQSNALAALQAVDTALATAVMSTGCVTGDRINGLVDGVTGNWYCKFDTFHPAVDNGLPVTRVISRVELQGILAQALPEGLIRNNQCVESFEEKLGGVEVVLDNGERVWGDVLVGCDGIRSRVRTQLLGPSQPAYSSYTCYTGIADFTPPDVDTVGYRVFLGNKQYFVSSDVGHGKQQWYAFHCEPAGGEDAEGTRKTRLLSIFGHWCDDVTDLIKNTPEEDVLRRDIYDRPPIMTWSKGRVTLLGDSAHAMQPNLGQGGGMAIEDAYTLACELSTAIDEADGKPGRAFLQSALGRYENKRRLRVGAIHGMARAAAEMASTYKAYLGEGLGPLSFIEKLRIPHPGSLSGKFVMQFAMPFMLDWILGGNSDIRSAPERAIHLGSEKPKLAGGMTEESFQTYLADDDAMLRAADADWLLVPICDGGVACAVEPMDLPTAERVAPVLLGRGVHPSCSNELVSGQHASVVLEASTGNYVLTDLNSTNGTWLNRGRMRTGGKARIVPGDDISLGDYNSGVRFRVKLRKRGTAPVAAGRAADQVPAAR